MAVSYQIWLRNNAGIMLRDLTTMAAKWSWARILNDVGTFSIHLPEAFDESLVDQNKATDQQVEIWRKAAENMPLRLELKGFIRRVVSTTDEQGKTWHVLTGVDAMDLLARRVVNPFVSGFWAPDMTNYADTIMRTVVSYNLGSGNSNDADRDLTTAAAIAAQGFTFAVENVATTTYCTTAGTMPNVAVGTYGLLSILQEISESSKTYKGTVAVPVYFNIDYTDWNILTFMAFANRIGNDHSSDSTNPVFVGLNFGNLQTPTMDVDRTNEITAVYSAFGSGSYREWALSEDDRRNLSPLNRRELAISFSGQDNTGGTGSREAKLNENKPKRNFSGRIVDAPGCLYGREWGHGDEITVSYLGQQYDVMVKAISAEYGEDGERISAVVEVQI